MASTATAPAVDEAVLALVRRHMHAVRVPSYNDKVYKDECMFSYDSPESPGGLYVNLTTFQGFGESFLPLDHRRSGTALYLHLKHTRVSCGGGGGGACCEPRIKPHIVNPSAPPLLPPLPPNQVPLPKSEVEAARSAAQAAGQLLLNAPTFRLDKQTE
ncbi:hypothetical protein Agub_g11425, partial [Astrephomene gubernaculifera]